jgi:Protein of unknown function (DUF3987)
MTGVDDGARVLRETATQDCWRQKLAEPFGERPLVLSAATGGERRVGDLPDGYEGIPLRALPGPLARLAAAAAAALPAPPDFVAVPGLGVLGAMLGTARVLEMKPGWCEGARIYAAVVADPGTRKSPALGVAVEPLVRAQVRYGERYEAELADYRRAQFEREAREAAYREAAKAAARKHEPLPDPLTPPPASPRVRLALVTDSTWEALAHAIYANPRGIVYVSDELTGWVKGMNAYRSGRGGDRQSWLSAWSGQPVVVNRRSHEPLVIPRPFVNVVGCLPPDVLADLWDERGREDGFVHRLLFGFPERVSLGWSELGIDPATLDAYCALAEALETHLQPDERGCPVIVGFDREGRDARAAFLAEELRPAVDAAPANLRGPFAKLEGYFARLALLLHACRYVSGEVASEDVDANSVDSAATLIRYFREQAERVYGRFSANPDEVRSRATLSWVSRHGGRASLREIHRSGVTGKTTAPEVHAFLTRLQDEGRGRLQEQRLRSGQLTSVFSIR